MSEAESQVSVGAHPSGCTCGFRSISVKSSRCRIQESGGPGSGGADGDGGWI